MFDLARALSRAEELTAPRYPDHPGVAALLARAQDEGLLHTQRSAALRLLGALVGEPLAGPQIVHLDIIGTCNANCVYCRDHSPYVNNREPWRNREMPYELAARLIDEAVALGAEKIPVVGAGENLLHSRFADLVDLLKRQPVDWEVYTNGLLWDDAMIHRFANAHRAMVTFSLSAATAPTWAAFRPEMSPHLFDKIEESIRKLVERREPGLKIGIVHVLNKRNVREVLPMIRRAIELGVDEIEYKLTELNEAARPLAPDENEIESIRQELRKAHELASAAGVDIHDNIEFQLAHVDLESGLYTKNLYDRIPCHVGYEMIRVRRDGAISFCCGLKFFGNAHETTLREHWHGATMRRCREAAIRMPAGDNERLPDGGMLRDGQCDFCYNYILNFASRRLARETGVTPLLPGDE